ncbi:hypothetical protein [Pantoea stewartii]|uniref:Repressor n=1 Tax=Pantoea stewartii subsp. stewartii DC283 TaxID=660596 RepID=H3REV4_PANSE|nr:hypothetical protein [Pantoea stewartii]ARF50837.1 repressor [Pantoea stewartii subsp. stewartii DC283]EHU00280.1 hypothetical protein CKS_2118 [Pantoea stewartii subsp. stewartii DC283]KAB0547459.1 hypothetical protein F7Q90_20860 [Pantoea stewartii subsp. stewartii]
MLMSKSAYAKHRGVSRQAVYDWIEKGEIVMSGSKIDVAATERQQQPPKDVAETAADPWANRTLEMTWGQFWEAVRASDGKKPAPVNNAEIMQRVRDAASELNWEIDFLDDGGVWLDDGDAEHYFQQYDFLQNAELAISLLRREVCYVAAMHPDDVDYWSEAGMSALAERARGNHR